MKSIKPFKHRNVDKQSQEQKAIWFIISYDEIMNASFKLHMLINNSDCWNEAYNTCK